MIAVCSQNWHATCEALHVFVFIGTIWLSNAEGRNPPNTLPRHSKYAHTLWQRDDNLTGDGWFLIYREASQFVLAFFYLYFNLTERV